MAKQYLLVGSSRRRRLELRVSPAAGRHTRRFAENLGKVALIVEPQIQGDTENRRFGISQELLGAFNPSLHDIRVRRLTSRLLELPPELHSAQTRHFAQLRQAKCLRDIFLYMANHPGYFWTCKFTIS